MQKILLTLLVTLGVFASCKEKSATQKQLHGYVVWENGYTTFMDCNTGKEYWLQDSAKQVETEIKKISTQPYQQVFFTLEGDFLPPATQGAASAYDNILQVNKVVVAQKNAPEGACVMKDSKPIFSCNGEDPKWSVTFGNDMKFKANFPNDTLVFFPLTEPQIRDSAGVGKVFYYATNNENFQNIQLIVTQIPCKTESGKIRSFSAKVIFGGITYVGCALLQTSTNTNEENLMPSTADNPTGSM